MVTNNRVNLEQVCSLNIEQSRLLQFTPRKTGQRSKRRERRPEANEEGNETRELGNKEKGTRGTEGRSDKEKEGGGRTTEEKRRVDYKKNSQKSPYGLRRKEQDRRGPPKGKGLEWDKERKQREKREGGGEPQRGPKVTDESKQSSGGKTAGEGSDRGGPSGLHARTHPQRCLRHSR